MEDDDVLIRFGIRYTFWVTVAIRLHFANGPFEKV